MAKIKKQVIANWSLARYKGPERKPVDVFAELQEAKNAAFEELGIDPDKWIERSEDRWHSPSKGGIHYVISPGSGLPTFILDNPSSQSFELIRHRNKNEGEDLRIATLRSVDDAIYHACERFAVPASLWQQVDDSLWQTKSGEFSINLGGGVTRNDAVSVARMLGIPDENVLDGDQALEQFGATGWLSEARFASIAADQAKQRTAKEGARSLWNRLFRRK